MCSGVLKELQIVCVFRILAYAVSRKKREFFYSLLKVEELNSEMFNVEMKQVGIDVVLLNSFIQY